MDFWGFLYAELRRAMLDVSTENTMTYRSLDMLAERASWVFEDWRDFGPSDSCTLTSRKLYGKMKRGCGQVAYEICEEAEGYARKRAQEKHTN